MNFSLDNNVNKLVLLLVAGVVLLLLIHMYKKNLGEQVSVLLSVVVLVVCGYFGYVLLNSPDENFINPNESPSPIYEPFQGHYLNKNLEPFNDHEKEHDEVHDEEPDEEPDEQADLPENFQNPEPSKDDKGNSNNSDMDSKSLFPSDSYSEWCKVSPNNDGDVNCKSLLNAGHHIGVNTVGCSMRNANRGLRSEPPNPQVQVSPWLQTTICPDPFRKPLDGCD